MRTILLRIDELLQGRRTRLVLFAMTLQAVVAPTLDRALGDDLILSTRR